MPRIDILFSVDGDIISRLDKKRPKSGDREYFYAKFSINGEIWDNIDNKRASFTRGNDTYIMPLEAYNDCFECKIPWEVMTKPGYFNVGMFGGNRLLTNQVKVDVDRGCLYDGIEPVPPTPDWFNKIDGEIDKINDVNYKDITDEYINSGINNIEEFVKSIKSPGFYRFYANKIEYRLQVLYNNNDGLSLYKILYCNNDGLAIYHYRDNELMLGCAIDGNNIAFHNTLIFGLQDLDESLDHLNTCATPKVYVDRTKVSKSEFYQYEQRSILQLSNGKYLGWDSGNYVAIRDDNESADSMLFNFNSDGMLTISLKDHQERKLQVNKSINTAAFYSSSQISQFMMYKVDRSAGEMTRLYDVQIDTPFVLIADGGDKLYLIKSLPDKRLSTMQFDSDGLDMTLHDILNDSSNIYEFIIRSEATTTQTPKFAEKWVEDIAKFGDGSNSLLMAGAESATGKNSVAVGEGTIASGDHQLAIGKHNKEDKSKLFVVGFGSSSNRNNVLTVDQAGNIKSAGYIEDKNGNRLDKVSKKLDDIWYGDIVTTVFSRYPVTFINSEVKLNINNPFTVPGLYAIKIGSISGSYYVTQADIDSNPDDIDLSSCFGPIETVVYNKTTGILSLLCSSIVDGNYHVGITRVDIKQIPLKYVLPEVTNSDNGKYLRVVNGEWKVST